jgi:hypothetical protein
VKSDTISKFNRDTAWLAAGVLGTVVFAALVLVIQECQPKATPAERDLLPIANSDNSDCNDKMTTGQASRVDHAVTETSSDGAPSWQTEPGAATPVRPWPPGNRHGARANPGSGFSGAREDSARAIGPKARKARGGSSWAFRSLDVKRRLIELWHLSLARSEKAQTWTAFSNLNRGARKKAAYTAETSP